MPTDNLPTIAPMRLPYHPALKEKYGIDAGQWRVLTDAIFPAARTIESVVMALGYCKSRNLDPFKRSCHIVPIWSSEKKCYIETVWPSISELRTTAFRTGTYAGTDAATWGEDRTQTWGTGAEKCEVTYPEWAQVTVYRLVAGQRCAFPGPRVYWLETFAHGKGSGPNAMWTKRPRGQIEKCALAAALRNAFPEEIGGDLSSDEAEGIQDFHQHIPVPADAPPPRLSKVEQMASAFTPPTEPEFVQLDAEMLGPDTVQDGVSPAMSEMLNETAQPDTQQRIDETPAEGLTIKEYADAVQQCKIIRDCNDLLRDVLPTVPENIRKDVASLVYARMAIIRSTRGASSNPQEG